MPHADRWKSAPDFRRIGCFSLGSRAKVTSSPICPAFFKTWGLLGDRLLLKWIVWTNSNQMSGRTFGWLDIGSLGTVPFTGPLVGSLSTNHNKPLHNLYMGIYGWGVGTWVRCREILIKLRHVSEYFPWQSVAESCYRYTSVPVLRHFQSFFMYFISRRIIMLLVIPCS